MEQNVKDILTEIILQRGAINDNMFSNDLNYKKKFLQDTGLEPYADKAKAAFLLHENNLGSEEQLKEAEKMVDDKCREILTKEGVDINNIIGNAMSDEEEREALLEQLEKNGISKEQAQEMGLDDAENVINYGKDIYLQFKDSPERRKTFDEKNIKYKIDKTSNTLVINARVDAVRGVAYEDTPEVRKILDENEIRYLKMAGSEKQKRKEKLVVPFNWMNRIYGLSNMQVVKNIEKLALIASTSFVISPAGTILLYVVLKRTGMLDKFLKQGKISPSEKKAMEHGLTVYKIEKEKVGRGTRETAKYYYMDNGNVFSINARDVRIPDQFKGIKLSESQKESFRKGEVVNLTDKKGKEFAVRIDVCDPKLYREYYREMRSDKNMTAVPNRNDTDDVKLNYIANFGLKGINDIYGESYWDNLRDTFLSRYNLKDKYQEAKSIDLYKHTDQKDIEDDNKLRSDINNEIKDKATESLKELRSNGFKR